MRSGVAVWAVVALVAGAAGGAELRPASLVAKNIQLVNGRAYLPLSDLATALGGTLTCNPQGSKCAIRTGANGVLRLNRGALDAFTALRQGNVKESSKGVGQGIRAGVMEVQVTLDGSDVGVQREEEEERLLLRPVPLMPLSLLGRLLGAQAIFDPGTQMWKLPPGDPGCPLSFR